MPEDKPPFLTEEQWRVHLEWLEQEKANPHSFTFLDGEGWDEPPPLQQWTVDQLFPRCETTLFSGNGGAGKSTIGLQLCCAHAIGKDWMGALPELGPAMFVDAEDHELVIRRRTYAIAQHYGVRPSDLFDGGLKIVSLHGKDAILGENAKGLIKPTKLFAKIEEAVSLFEPQTVVIASAANFYGGSEIDRGQVTQFIGLMNRLAVAANGSVILISHPSVLGMENDTGLSGSTQWHNAVRARMYLKSANGGEDSELRQLEFRKNQYGPAAKTVTVKWRDGLFLPVGGPSSFEQAAAEAQINDAFRAMLRRLEKEAVNVSPNPKANNYAPKVLSEMPEAVDLKLKKPALAQAMHRLLKDGAIHTIVYGKASRPIQRLSTYAADGDALVTHG